MKAAALIFSFLMTVMTAAGAQARTVNFLCESGTATSLNRFTGSGLVEINGNKGEGHFSGSFTAAGNNSEPQEIGELSAKGEARIIPPGEFAKNEVIVLQLAAEREEKPVRMIFNLGISGPVSSTLILNGVQYKAQCSEYKE